METKDLRAVLALLWLRLITICVITLLLAATLRDSPGRVGGWHYYLTSWEIVFELAVRVAALALVGAVLGTIIVAAVLPLLFRDRSRNQLAERVLHAAQVLAAFSIFAIIVKVLCDWAGLTVGIALIGSYCLAFGWALYVPVTRKWLMTSLDDLLKEKTVRQMAVAIVVVITAVVVAERALRSVTTGVVRAAPAVERSVPNILLITFDALSAEDMSVYGYQLPTTPRMDEFARKSTVFTNFFSASTFTTPSIGTILTGIYPSEHHVYGLKGHLSLADASRTLPHLLRTGKYSTGASMTNPAAYSLNAQLGAEYDVLLSPAYHTGAFMVAWNALALLHQQQPFGSRLEELDDLESVWDSGPLWLANYLPGQFRHTISRFPASGTFAQARELLNRLPGRFFLWVHVYAPHLPYLPDPPYLGRFLASNEMRTAEDQDMSHLYSPKMQGKIDKARLRYDEFLAEADQALGAFLDQAERAGRLRNTAVIISADHGESFQGGVYTHGTEDQVRPQIHIPLIIRMPEQKQGARIAFTADQTALAPTLLEMAGLPQPPYMRGKSLLPWLSRDGGGEGEGFAFTQYLEWNKVSEPLSNGTVGVISGGYQYILDLRTRTAQLRSLAEADRLDADRSAGNAGLTNKLLQAIYTRFPDLPRRSRSSNLNPRHE